MRNTLFAIGLFCLLLITSCAPKTFTEVGGTIVTCQFPDMQEKGETPEAILNILQERMRRIDPNIVANASYNEADATFTVEVPILKGEVVDILFAHGEMSINEVVRNARDILTNVAGDTLFSLLAAYDKSIPFETHFQPSVIAAGMDLTLTEKSDMIDLLNKPSIKDVYPTNTQFIWTYGEKINGNEDKIESYLHAIKTNGGINLNQTVGSSKIEHADYDPLIHIILNEAGGKQFYELTNNNKGFPLAIVCDDKVLSVPNVMNSIEGGNMSISGNFDLETLSVLKALLSPNTIKSTVKIIGRKEVGKEL